jgi:hypothetical protein
MLDKLTAPFRRTKKPRSRLARVLDGIHDLTGLATWEAVHLAARMGKLRGSGDLIARTPAESGEVQARYLGSATVLSQLVERLNMNQSVAYTVELCPTSPLHPGAVGRGPLVVLVWPDDELVGPGELLGEVVDAVTSTLASATDIQPDDRKVRHLCDLGPTLLDEEEEDSPPPLSAPPGPVGDVIRERTKGPTVAPDIEPGRGWGDLPQGPSWWGSDRGGR